MWICLQPRGSICDNLQGTMCTVKVARLWMRLLHGNTVKRFVIFWASWGSVSKIARLGFPVSCPTPSLVFVLCPVTEVVQTRTLYHVLFFCDFVDLVLWMVL